MACACRCAPGLLAVSPAAAAVAHEVRPGYLELREREAGIFSTCSGRCRRWGRSGSASSPRFRRFLPHGGEPIVHAGGRRLHRTRPPAMRAQPCAARPSPSTGSTRRMTDVLVRVEARRRDGRRTCSLSHRRRHPSSSLPQPGRLDVLATYVRLGIEHILTGPTICFSCSACCCWFARSASCSPRSPRSPLAHSHHARRGDPRLHPCAFGAGRGDDRPEHRLSRQRAGAGRWPAAAP